MGTESMRENKKLIGVLFSGETDRKLLRDFLLQEGYSVSAPELPEFNPEAWDKIDLILVESSLAENLAQELMVLKQKTFWRFSFLPVIVAIPTTERVSRWLNFGFDDVLFLPMDKELLAIRIRAWLRLKDETTQHFRDPVERSPIGFYRTTPQGQILYANPAIIRMLGFNSLEELARRNLEEEGFEPTYPRSYFKEVLKKEGRVTGLESIWKKKDGTRIWVRESARAIKDDSGQLLYYEGTVEDITARVEAEEAYFAVVENALQGLAIIQNNRVVFANQALEKLSGYSREELLSFTPTQMRNVVHPEDRHWVWENMQRRLRGEAVPASYEFRFLRKDGAITWARISAALITFRGQPALLVSYLDVTEEKKLADRLEAIRELGKKLVFTHSKEEVARAVVEGAQALLGLDDIGFYLVDSTRKKLNLVSHSYQTPPGPERFSLRARRGIVPFVARTGKSVYLPDVSKHPRYVAGSKETRSEFCLPLKVQEKVSGVLNIESPKLNAFGPAEQKLIETLADVASVALGSIENLELLFASEERFRHLAQSSPDIIYRYRFWPQPGFDYVSPAITKIAGYTPEEVYSHPDIWLEMVYPEDRPILEAIRDKGESLNVPIELRWVRKDGRVIWGEHINVPVYDHLGNLIAIDGIARDITERKQIEERIQQAYKAMLALLDNVEDVIYVADMETYEILFANLYTKRLLEKELIGGLCYREFQHLDAPCSFCTNEKIKALGYAPYYWEYHNPVTDRDYFIIDRVIRWPDGREVRFEVARDITELKAKEREVRDYAEKVERLFDQVVGAFSSAMELRDPYTAGHQFRVAELSYAIGKELGFSADEIQGLKVAALLHDIGKGLFVPAEILTKPGKLTHWEMALIKVHRQAGYEILKNVDFPWPVAEVIRQHHERLDGSGYPQGLKGDEILLEAKIIAVADVVEAMSSHRPYRPSLGLAAALKEIEAQKGRLYDPKVVEACLRIFSRGFSFAPYESSTFNTNREKTEERS